MKTFGKVDSLNSEGARLYLALTEYLERTGLDAVIDIHLVGSEDVRISGNLDREQAATFRQQVFKFDGAIQVGYGLCRDIQGGGMEIWWTSS